MSKPTPVLRRGRWSLDLRWADLGQYTLRTPGVPELAIEATQEAYAVFERERAAAEAKAVQGSIFAGPSFRLVARAWADELDPETNGGARYLREYLSVVVQRFGDRAVRQFAPPAGTQVLRAWRDEMGTEGPGWLSWRTRRNRLNVTMQVLRFAVDRGHLPALPVKPSARVPADGDREEFDSDWYTEADFRALRDGLFVGAESQTTAWLVREQREGRLLGETVDGYIARRRLYASFGFYTGMHPFDLDRLDDRSFAPDIGTFLRRNHKSARVIRPKCFEAPERLHLDVQEEIRRLGRPWRKDEPIAGGPWPRGAQVLEATARRLGLPTPVNFRSVFRRSTVHELRLRGWPEHEVADYLGHVDKRMVQEVYGRVVDRLCSPVKIPWTCESAAHIGAGRPVTGRARVLSFKPVALAPDSQDEGS